MAATADTVCRFGITSPIGSDGYDIASLGVGSYLDWEATSNPSLPTGVEYMRILRLRDDLYPQTRADFADWVEDNPGSVWIVGNEPDTYYNDQDALLPEVYADRYYELAMIIRNLDPTARITFGSVVQPTPIRIRYLQRAWNRLIADAGGTYSASNLVDFWTIHAFILNEQLYWWGTGIPPGFENDHDDAIIIYDFADTYSSTIFQQRVIAFRAWMASIGERNKPLWITEYGSLFPPEDPPGGPNYYNVSNDNTKNFMLATFDFLLSASDEQTGLPGDGNQLVQRWFWYSLNDYPYNFGGSLYDPRNGSITKVGEGFIDYQTDHLIQPDLLPANLAIAPKSFNPDRTLVNYRLDVTIENLEFNDATCAQVWIYDGNPENGGSLIAGPLPASRIEANYDKGKVTVYWLGVQPFTEHTIYIDVEPIGVADIQPNNNWESFTVYTELPHLNFLPIINH